MKKRKINQKVEMFKKIHNVFLNFKPHVNFPLTQCISVSTPVYLHTGSEIKFQAKMNDQEMNSNGFDDETDDNDVLVFHILITDPLRKLK